KPRRHPQIGRRQFEPQLARLLDEGEVLVRKRQNRDLGEIDLLLAREREQEIERALEALHIDDQCRFVARALGSNLGFKWDVVHEVALRAAAPSLTSAAHSARSAARSSLGTLPRRPTAASPRPAPSPVSTRTPAPTASPS